MNPLHSPRPLGQLSPHEFLSKYWQKRPLIIRGAFLQLQLPFDGGHLAGLSLKREAHSRIVIQKSTKSRTKAGKGKKVPTSPRWEVLYGPFKKSIFTQLPKDRWTLLVQETDHWIPEIAELRKCFRFIPDWRVDDVMISYATDQGSVGPHTDQYDVFLLQGQGRRRWLIESQPRDLQSLRNDFVPNLDLKILSNFRPDREYLLETGDMLYLPPGVAHHGISEGEGLTISIGFRAPSGLEMMGAHLESISELLEEVRYSDGDLRPQSHPSEISPQAIDQALHFLKNLPHSREEVEKWFGRLVTAPKREAVFLTLETPSQLSKGPAVEIKSLQKLIRQGLRVVRDPGSRMAFIKKRSRPKGPRTIFFVQGAEREVPPSWNPLLEKLCRDYELSAQDLRPHAADKEFLYFLSLLERQGILSFEQDGNE